MPEKSNQFSLRRLGPDDIHGFGAFTYPAYRKRWLGGEAMIAIGASAGDRPSGLALAAQPSNGHGEVLSLFVAPESRAQGLGCALLAQIEEALAACGARFAVGNYVTGDQGTLAIERVLAKSGWAPPMARMLMFQAELAEMQGARWLQNAALGEGFELMPWRALAASAHEQLRSWQRAEGWIPEDLEPWRHEEDCEPATSLALRLEGRVVGWVLTHRLEPDLLRFSSGWVHPDLQRRGRLFALYAASGDRALALGYERASWTVPLHHEAKAAFARRWMAPYARCRETRGSAKLLLDTTRLQEDSEP